jgi:hypothetical protein
MNDQLERLKPALADRYAIERELGAGGMAIVQHPQGWAKLVRVRESW